MRMYTLSCRNQSALQCTAQTRTSLLFSHPFIRHAPQSLKLHYYTCMPHKHYLAALTLDDLDMQTAPGLNTPINQPRQASSMSSSSKVDPTQVPRPSAKGEAPEEYRTMGNQYPNPPTTQARFIVRDTGNANPRFMRCTLSMMPYSSDLLKQSAMPLAVVVQPFALLDPADDPTQVSSPTHPPACFDIPCADPGPTCKLSEHSTESMSTF